MKAEKLSIPVLRRLPLYYHLVLQLQKQGETYVSSAYLAQQLNLEAIQVRKDIALTGVKGKPKRGYLVVELLEQIQEELGWKHHNEAILVGCGHLGAALLGYQGFSNYGFDIVVAFDSDPKLIETKIHGKLVVDVQKMPDLCRRMHIDIGIITAPAAVAQSIADLMIESNIQAIWNFAPTALHVPEQVIVQQQDMTASLSILFNKLRNRQ